MEYLALILVLVLLILGVILRVKKGAVGETVVSRKLRSLPKDEYTVIDDLLLNT